VAELIPAPFASLLRRMLREFEREGKIFDLPARKFWHGSPDLDTSVLFHGHTAASPVGPAAGPHAQMAQNIALAWLAGSRILELKTVQIQDRLTIPRPCIDMTNVGYNVEWSQELRLEESLREYVAGSMLVDVLRELNLTGRPSDLDKQDTLFDLSVGYDLEGVRSERVRTWMASLKDASHLVDLLRRQIPDELRHLRDVDFRTRISDQVTLSTFHGCPAHEIEAIARFLLLEMGLHVTVKLNPTLLGREAVDGLLHDLLGYTEIQTRPEDFAKDLQWEQALEITDRLCELARSLGRTFRVKLSNTLVVRNHKSFFPRGEQVMYLSGAPLHVITLTLVERFRRARPEVPISFSAGVDSRNFSDCVALGFTPVTVCSDLLKPGGYGRLPRYVDQLEERMRALGVRCLGDFVVKAAGRGEPAVAEIVPAGPLREALLASLASRDVDLRGVLTAHGEAGLYEPLVERAAQLNTPVLVAKAAADPRYRAAHNRAVPRKVGSHLRLFDCINCDKCLPACPNDANFAYETHAFECEYSNWRVEGGAAVALPGGRFAVREEHQLATFQDFCNECGNCDTFCPEDGGPYLEKPLLCGSLEAWDRLRPRDGFFLRRSGDFDLCWGRVRGAELHLEVDRVRGRGLFTDGRIEVELHHPERRALGARVRPGAPDGHVLDLAAYFAMAAVLDGVLDARHANPVNTRE
jgi:putative selenate reductase